MSDNLKFRELSYQYRKDTRSIINHRIIHIFIAIICCIILYGIVMSMWNRVDYFEAYYLKTWIYIYGWIGIGIYIYILYTIKVFTGKIFCPYTIFCLFIFLFNYGQFILWALGIHYEGELGTTAFIRYMDQPTLLKIEIVSTVSILAFHIGALISMLNSKIENISCSIPKIMDKNYFCDSLKILCTFFLIISTPVVIYESYTTLKIALQYGYTSIYYGGYTEINPILKYITYFFFPSMIGSLVSNKFSSRSFYIVSTIFTIYMFINLLAGDRGSWVYYIIILYWCYITYVKKISIKSFIKYLILGCMLLICTSVLVKFREVGFNNITLDDYKQIAKDIPYVFIKPFFEMGQSARVLGIIIQDNLSETWRYGNTYIAAISGMFIPRIKTGLGFPDFYLDNWISQIHLGLGNYGVGFSIIAEAYLNGGILFLPLIMMMLGFFIGLITKCDSNSLKDPRRMFITLSSTGVLLTIARGSMELSLRKWAYGVILILIGTDLLRELIYKKGNYKNNIN